MKKKPVIVPTPRLPRQIKFEIKHWLIALFLLTRLFIWVNKPQNFTEIIYSYMPYAHLWASGVMPYREQWYEYPPATVPLFYLPHWIDKNTHGTAFHINYSNAYRGELLLIDIFVFFMIWQTLTRLKVHSSHFTLALLYYILLTTKAHDFIYDTMDLSFAAAITLGVVAPIIMKKFGQITSWASFFLAVALKYVNLPLGLVHLVTEKNWKEGILRMLIGGLIIWTVPLMIFRSSLSVSFVYHNMRGIQIDSAPSILLRTLDRFTHSEQVIEKYKNYEISGPMTEKAKKYVGIIFPAAIVGYVLSSAFIFLKNRNKFTPDTAKIIFTFGYLLVFMLTAKVLSTPFLLWHIPLLAIYPFRNVKKQIPFLLASAVIIFTSMTQVSNAEIGIFPLPLIVGWIRTISFLAMLLLWVNDVRERISQSNE